DGPERAALEQQAERLGLTSQVEFAGTRRGTELAALLNGHKIMAVPSRWEEPFGLVALEGIACGCVAVASTGGGLPDAVGPCGILFERGNAESLAQALRSLLSNPEQIKTLRSGAEAHLKQHSARSVARNYLKVIEGAAR